MKKQLIAFGLASMLTVPTWLAAAQPMDVSAKKKVTVSKKTKAVISKIKALNSKKSNYVKNTLAAQTAYKKLSKTERKKVSNYKTLQKHMKAVQPMVNQVNSLKKQAAKLSSKNYKTQAAKVSIQYGKLKKAAKEYVPKSTVNKITYYDNLNSANVNMRKLMKSAAATGIYSLGAKKSSDILSFIVAYEKLSDNQKRILGGSQEEIEYLLQLKPIVQLAINYDAQYEKLDQTNSSYLKQAYDLHGKYKTDCEQKVETSQGTRQVSHFVKKNNELINLKDTILTEVKLKEDFEKAVNALPGKTPSVNDLPDKTPSVNDLPGKTPSVGTKRLELVETAVGFYKNITSTTHKGEKLKGKPIDIVDKKVLAEYKKYETIPSVVKGFDDAPPYDSDNTFDQAKLAAAGFDPQSITNISKQGRIPYEKNITTLDTAIKNYTKLGADQKEIVDEAVGTTKKNYVNDSAAIKKGQAMTKGFNDGIAKNDLAAIMKQFDLYKKAAQENDRSIRYVSASDLLSVAPVTYKTQLDNVGEFEKEAGKYATKADIQKLVTLYQTIEKDKPSGLKMIDAKVAKDYTLAKSVLEIDTLMAKSKPSYTTAKLNNILAATKLYSKLDASKKLIVDGLGHNVEGFVEDEAAIKQAMAVDKKYLALKPSQKSYTKDAKSVFNSYLDANDTVKKYILNSTKISNLVSTLKEPQDKVDLFEEKVNTVYEEVYSNDLVNKTTIAKIKDEMNRYENTIKPYAKYNNLVDSDVMKKYKKLTPIVDVYNQIFNLKPTPTTELQRENILTAKKAFNKLDTFGKKVIQIEDKVQSKLRLLDDEKQIQEAKKIDGMYKLLNVNDTKYESKLYNVYKEYVKATDDVKNYVINKGIITAVPAKYDKAIKAAIVFEESVQSINRTSKIINVHQLKAIYDQNKKVAPEFVQFVDPAIVKKYDEYIQLLFIQDVAQNLYEYQRINGNWIKYDAWFYAFSQRADNLKDVLNMRKALLYFKDFNPVQMSILNNSPNYTSYEGLAEDPNGNNIPIYDNDKQIIGYKPELDYKDKFEPDEVIYNPIDWLNYTQVQNLLDAMKYEERYKALNNSGKNNARDAIKLVRDFEKESLGVRGYFLYRPELEQLENTFAIPVAYADAFEAAVKAYDPNTGNVTGLEPMRLAYNKLDSTALSIVSASLLKQYKDYMLLKDLYSQYQEINLTANKMSRIENMELFLTAYTKLPAGSKKIVRNSIADPTFFNLLLTDEKDIRAAHAVDKKYEKLDTQGDSYEVEALKLYKEYAKLTTNAQNNYSVYGQILVDLHAKYGDSLSFGKKEDNAKATADEFTRLVTALNADSTYADVVKAAKFYDFLSVPQQYTGSSKKVIGLTFVDKPIVTKYKLYEGLITIKEQLDKVKVYPKAEAAKYTVTEKEAIKTATAAYKKLAKDPKNILEQDAEFGLDPNPNPNPENEKRYLLLIEEDIKVAEAADANFLKIKKGDKSFVKNVVIAMKSYNVLTNLQKQFFTQTKLYTTYKKYDKADTIKGAVDTIPEAIKVIVDFEIAIQETQELHDEINQTPPPHTVPQEKYTAIRDKMVKANEAYNFINRDFNIEGQVIRPLSLADKVAVQRYKYFMAVYKVQEYLDNLKK
ncbi:hypothetical protein QN089_02450 [Kurthia sp. YJT4]|uniref:hypothetical protein n=1 Tax=Kurthia sp. YJT4 TaxID=3049086 RepID=UPI00254F5728|nr:hypothetical protein [Kurthia sp. YJT4]WIL39140.1 hypothetical protein QN089_02450 [Kurthia sp. YJT4]